jgi:hypothetical protein
LFVLAYPIAAHGAFAGFACDVILSDDLPGTGVDTIFATDASLLVNDHRSFFVFRNRLNGTNRSAGRKIAVHAAVAGPEWRESFEHRRLHRDPVGAGQFVESRARVIIPILASLHAVPATDALGRIEQNASGFAIPEASGGYQIAVLLG